MIIALPVVGMVSYLLLGGRTNVGAVACAACVKYWPVCRVSPTRLGGCAPALPGGIPNDYSHLFRVGHSVVVSAVGGNHGRCCQFNASIESLVSDIDAAGITCAVFYIWLPDNNGLKVVEALKRAALRKVTYRVMADGLSSRIMIDSSI